MLPLHLLGVGHFLELLAQVREVDLLAPHCAEGDAHEEPLRDRVVELLHFDDVEAPRGEERGHPRRRAHAARAGGSQHEGVFGVETHAVLRGLVGFGVCPGGGDCQNATMPRKHDPRHGQGLREGDHAGR